MNLEIPRPVSDALPSDIDLPFQDMPRDDETMKLGQSVSTLPEYTDSRQGHRINDGEDLVYVTGIYLNDASSDRGGYAIYRDPRTGEVYKVKKG